MITREDYKTPNEDLYQKIQQVYSAYFKPEMEYKQGTFQYANALRYGYVDFQERKYDGKREFTADEYAAFCGTHCTHTVSYTHLICAIQWQRRWAMITIFSSVITR